MMLDCTTHSQQAIMPRDACCIPSVVPVLQSCMEFKPWKLLLLPILYEGEDCLLRSYHAWMTSPASNIFRQWFSAIVYPPHCPILSLLGSRIEMNLWYGRVHNRSAGSGLICHWFFEALYLWKSNLILDFPSVLLLVMSANFRVWSFKSLGFYSCTGIWHPL